MSKKNLFILGKDIWAEEESRAVRKKRKMCETEVLKPKTAVQVSVHNIGRTQADMLTSMPGIGPHPGANHACKKLKLSNCSQMLSE